MLNSLMHRWRGLFGFSCFLLVPGWNTPVAQANPIGGTVAQGTATFNTSGSQFTIATSDRAFINWQSFNIGVGQTTTFVQPSATSLVWNQINDANPSQILGNLNANGYVVLQNPNGFYVGGQAAITTHGLMMTTAPIPMPDLSSGGAWSFGAPPPTASIINYGQINIGGGGSAFLIAHNIQNQGSITAPGGNIGLYAGQQVLVSTRPDGRGLSATVTLPQGSVDNQGRLIADGGSIALHAQVVNQGGLVQANSILNHDGVIELIASDAINLSASSLISAKGDSQGASQGGKVTIKSDNTFADQSGSALDISGGAQGGSGGQAEISAANLGGIQSSLNARATSGFLGGGLLIDPTTITLNTAQENTYNNLITSGGLSSFSVLADTISLINSWTTPSSLLSLNVKANNNLTIGTLWTLNAAGAAAALNLTAGNDIVLNTGSGIKAGNNWSVNLTAGPQNLLVKPTTARTDGIYLDGTSYIQTQNGSVNLWAANELLVNSGAIRTLGGGNISAIAHLGNINTGTGTSGFNYLNQAPYYTPFTVSITGAILGISSLGGISTAGGGNVTITAGGDVTSYLANSSASKTIAIADPGAGAFGSQPGNVTITAGGNVFGHYVVANGVGSISAGKNIGNSGQNVALSLVKGSWNLDAPNGNIYLQEVRNPNGVFDQPSSGTSPGTHLFNYDDAASVSLNASIGVYLTGSSLPRPVSAVPIIYPPSLDITAGSGGVNFLNSVILFPSPDQNLSINTTGNGMLNGNGNQLSMSDTSRKQWTSGGAFTATDIGTAPLEINNPNPVLVKIAGNMENFSLVTDKATQISVGGDMIGCNFSGQNLHAGDITSINVFGQIFNQLAFNSVFLSQSIPGLPLADLPPNSRNDWKAILKNAVSSSIADVVIPPGTTPSQYYQLFSNLILLRSIADNFYYNSATRRLTYVGDLNSAINPGSTTTVAGALEHPLTIVRYGPDGNPLTALGADGKLHFVTDTITWVDPLKIASLAVASLGTPALTSSSGGYHIGGPGEFDIHANSISLGNTLGILSYGVGGDYGYLAPYTPSGASVNVTVAGNLEMPASTIAALGGGNVKVISTGGAMDLGSQDLLDVEQQVVNVHGIALGIYSSGRGNVDVTALGNINVDSSRIAAFNGGNVTVLSQQGNVDAGLGGLNIVPIPVYFVNPRTGKAGYYTEPTYANGIVAETLMDPSVPGSATRPGNIVIQTPRGDILASAGGILQEALSGDVQAAGPTITLTAGTAPVGTPGTPGYVPGFTGNISLGNSGVIGGAVAATANGNITGLVISRQDSTINAAASFSGTVLSGGSASLSAGGTVSGTVIGIGGASVSGGQGVTASVLSQNASVNGGAAQSTLGTSSTATATSQSAANQASSDAKEKVVASNTTDDDEKKKKGKGPVLSRRISRVTVLLPAKS